MNKQTIEQTAAECYPLDWDTVVFSCGFRAPIVDRSYLTKDEFLAIVEWKSPRSKAYARRNPPAAIEEVTREAFVSPDPCSAIRELDGLHGVGVRVASAILTVWDPKHYTVMDWRSCAALGRWDVGYTGRGFTADSYVDYLDVCRRLAQKHGVSLRQLDRFLWVQGGRLVAARKGLRAIKEALMAEGEGSVSQARLDRAAATIVGEPLQPYEDAARRSALEAVVTLEHYFDI